MREQIVTIQKTSKKWKLLKLISFILLVWGGILSFSSEQLGTAAGGIALIVLSAILYILAKILGWWFHG